MTAQFVTENGGSGESRKLTLFFSLAHNLTLLCLGGVVMSALIIGTFTIPSGSLSQHIILCTSGYFILMTQAVLSFSPYSWANNLKYEHKKITHFALNLVGCILAVSGTFIRMNDLGYSLQSAHGIAGLIAMILAICSVLGGTLSFLFPSQMNNKITKIGHACTGIATLCVAFIALVIGFNNLYRQLLSDSNANFSITLAVIAVTGSLLMAMYKNVNRILNK